ncbi:MAG: DUF2474 domain-containing protein [Rhizobiales bacterium]|nr:DUF2474 domain-containing protein [Hyphomicrobiales bacterium]
MPDQDDNPKSSPSWGKRTLWFVLFWIAGVLTLAAISYSLRTLLSIPY